MKNRYDIINSSVAIHVDRRSGEVITTYVDLDDLPRLQELSGKWCAKVQKDGKIYFYMNQYPSSTHLWLHRFINNSAPRVLTDHIDNNTLNNRKDNLRSVTPTQNQHNQKLSKNSKSGMNGVQWYKPDKKCRVRITVNGVLHEIGKYKELEDAKKACVKARQELQEGFVLTEEV